jgi:DNA-binding response OmpR family regulator
MLYVSSALALVGGGLSMVTKKRIALIVEDDPTLNEAVVTYLKAQRFDARGASDFETAVKALETLEPSVVCVDLGLPSESGYELCEHIRKQSKLASVPILVMSERIFPEDMAHAEEAGANAFLKKPFTMQQLSKYIHALLDGPRASRPSVRRLQMP